MRSPRASHSLWRRYGLAAVVALGALWGAWLGFRIQTMGDYPVDYAPAMNALLGGHVAAFFAHLPTNGAGGSILLRAPAAFVGKLLIGSQLAMFRFGALGCLLATGLLGLWLARELEARGGGRSAQVATVGMCLFAPAILDAIRFGHPEEPLGAALCVGAVLAAGADRSNLAGILLGCAVINKPWGVLAIAPVLLAAPEHRRVGIGARAGAIAGAWTVAVYLAAPARAAKIVIGASTSVVAHPVDLWWPLAHLQHVPGVTAAYFPPRLVSGHARALAVLLVIPLSLPLARRRVRSIAGCLALLALLFLVRCLLDPSNHVYYQVPVVIALTAWEVRARGRPMLALVATAGFWLVFHTVSGIGSLDIQYLSYLAVALPLLGVLVRPAFGRDGGDLVAERPRRLSPA